MRHSLRTLVTIGVAASLALTAPVLKPSGADAAPDSTMRRVAVDLQAGRAVAPGPVAGSVGDAHGTEEDGALSASSVPADLSAASAPIDAGETVMVGARWTNDAVVEVRTRTDGEWGPWMRLEQDTEEHVPDPGSPEWDGARAGVSEPVWTGPVDQLQFRSTDPGKLDVNLVDAVGGQGLAWSPTDAGAGAAYAEPKILPRTSWGADESLRSGRPSYADEVRFSVVHHVGGSTPWTWQEINNGCTRADDMIRSYYRYHTTGHGWSDIGYNFIVDPCGRVWEGRYGGTDWPVVGAHAGGFNTGSVGILALGTFDSSREIITEAMINSIERLVGWKLALHGNDPYDHANGTYAQTREVSGGGSARKSAGTVDWLPVLSAHQVSNNTSCPGEYLMRRLFTGRNQYGIPNSEYLGDTHSRYHAERSALPADWQPSPKPGSAPAPEPEPEPEPDPAPSPSEPDGTSEPSRVGVCPAPEAGTMSFTDVKYADGFMARYILCQADYGIAGGYGDGSYRPSGRVTREQMARFIFNLVETGAPDTLDPDAPNPFRDVRSGSEFEDDISALADADIISGVGNGYYQPDVVVSRAQMAKFVSNAIQAITGASFVSYTHNNPFTDVIDGSVFEPYISALAANKVVRGVDSDRYAPAAPVTRGAMALFTINAGQAAWEQGHWAATEDED